MVTRLGIDRLGRVIKGAYNSLLLRRALLINNVLLTNASVVLLRQLSERLLLPLLRAKIGLIIGRLIMVQSKVLSGVRQASLTANYVLYKRYSANERRCGGRGVALRSGRSVFEVCGVARFLKFVSVSVTQRSVLSSYRHTLPDRF